MLVQRRRPIAPIVELFGPLIRKAVFFERAVSMELAPHFPEGIARAEGREGVADGTDELDTCVRVRVCVCVCLHL
jgi:hypothetical protein